MASGFTCPDCSGSLMQVEPVEASCRCRVGHARSADALSAAQDQALERALWVALRTLDEKVDLASRMHVHNRLRGNELLAARHEGLQRESAEAVEVLRKHLTSSAVLNGTDAGI